MLTSCHGLPASTAPPSRPAWLTSVELTSEDPQVDHLQDQPGRGLVGRHAHHGRRLHVHVGDPERHERRLRRRRCSTPPTTATRTSQTVEAGADEKEVIVTYSKPYADWKGLFDPLVMPRQLHRARWRRPGHQGFNDASSSPSRRADVVEDASRVARTRSVDYTAGQSLTLERNDAYWGEPAPLDELVFPFITDSAASSRRPSTTVRSTVGFPQAQIDLSSSSRASTRAESEIGFGHVLGAPRLQHAPTRSSPTSPCARPSPLAIDREAIVDGALKPGLRRGRGAEQPHLLPGPDGLRGQQRRVRDGRHRRGQGRTRGGRLDAQGLRRHLREGRPEDVLAHRVA